MRLSIDISLLGTADRRDAIRDALPAATWSDDGDVAAWCELDPAAPGVLPQSARSRVSRAWIDAWRARPGHWPDLQNVVAAGAIVDLRRGEFMAAVDRMGVHSLYWSCDRDQLRIATRAADALPAPDAVPTLDPSALLAYVYFHHVPSPLCIFRGLAKLPRAHALNYRSGKLSVGRYRLEEFAAGVIEPLDVLASRLLDSLDDGVKRAIADVSAPGAFLSGGLDSSTVAGLLARHSGPGAGRSFTIGFDAEGYDEMEFARVAASHFGLRGHEHYLSPDEVLALTPALLRATDEPFGNSSIAAAYACASLARAAGITLMLAGDGGDELFAGNTRYAKQQVFERYLRLPASLRRHLIEPMIGRLGRKLPGTPLGKASRFVDQANLRLPDRLQSYNYLHRHAPSQVFDPGFLEQVDTALPLRMWREEYRLPHDCDTVNRMLFLDWAFTLHDNDLVKVNTACRIAGVQVAYPMLDHAVVELSCGLPGRLKMRGNELRWFYKYAARKLLPDRIIRKRKHGFGVPFGVWTRTHKGLRTLSERSLQSLAERRIFRPEFLFETLRLHREGHAAYYGELVWLLMALELWLDANASPRAS